jgi:hypothetical protein
MDCSTQSCLLFSSFRFRTVPPQEIDLTLCNEETKGFVWMHLVLVSELAIFSVRAPSYFWSSIPSVWPFLGLSLLPALVVALLLSMPVTSQV